VCVFVFVFVFVLCGACDLCVVLFTMTTTTNSSSSSAGGGGGSVIAQFVTAEGEATGPQVSLPLDINQEQLQFLINELLTNVILALSLLC